MKNASFHLNLLSEAEKMSSSPIRLRIMRPVLAILAVIGMMVWWGMLTTQMLLVHTKTSSIRAELESKKSAHDAIVGNMNLANEEAAQLQQLEMYRGGCRNWGATFASIAEVLPVKIQIVRLEIPEPPTQVLYDPKNPKRPPLRSSASASRPGSRNRAISRNRRSAWSAATSMKSSSRATRKSSGAAPVRSCPPLSSSACRCA